MRRVRPRWLGLGYEASIVPSDHTMATGMLRGLQDRVTGWSTDPRLETE